MAKIFNDIHYFDNVYDAICEVDALVIMTEWNEFRALDLKKLASSMTSPRMADLRNIYSAKDAELAGFEAYDSIGRASFGTTDG